MRESSKIKQPKSLLNQNIDFLDGIKLNKDYTIFVPQTSMDLINIGNSLGICVGNGYYAKKVLKKECNIIGIKFKGNYSHCVEFNKNRLIQCRGRTNRQMENALEKALKEIIYKKPEKNTNKAA